jgi:type I restriction enzyme R subunit
MIVCRSNLQAKLINKWFGEHSELKTGLVLSDSEDPKQAAINKTHQEDFRNNGTPDILVVHYMLTTGYDVKRLKKMYLLRAPKAHSLLQTISRVNRPYKNKEIGKTYKYGYIVDFVDIEEEYNNSLQAYVKELEDDSNKDGDEGYSLTGLVVDKEDIQKKYLKLLEDLKRYPVNIDNIEVFSQTLPMLAREALIKIRQILNGIKECSTEFELSRAFEYAAQIDKDRNKKLLRVVQLRIDLLNLRSQTIDTLAIMNNKEVMEIIYEFFKTRVLILDLGAFNEEAPEVKELKEAIEKLQNQVKRNKNRNDIKIKKLEELLKDVFSRLNINNIEELTEELKKAANEAEKINDENDRLAEIYGGHYSFVKTFSDSIINYNVDKSDVEKLLLTIYDDVKEKLKGDSITIQGKTNFIKAIQKNITPVLFNTGLYSKVKGCLSDILSDLYTNIQLFM